MNTTYPALLMTHCVCPERVPEPTPCKGSGNFPKSADYVIKDINKHNLSLEVLRQWSAKVEGKGAVGDCRSEVSRRHVLY